MKGCTNSIKAYIHMYKLFNQSNIFTKKLLATNKKEGYFCLLVKIFR